MTFIPKKFRTVPVYPALLIEPETLFTDGRYADTVDRVIRYLHGLYVNYSDGSYERISRPNTITEQFVLCCSTIEAHSAEIDLCNAIYQHSLGRINDADMRQVLAQFIDTHIIVWANESWAYKFGGPRRTGREVPLFSFWWLPIRFDEKTNCVVNSIQRFLYEKLETLSGNNAQYRISSL